MGSSRGGDPGVAPGYSQHEVLLPGGQVAPHRNGRALDILHLQCHVSVKLLCGSKGRVKQPPVCPPPPGHIPLPPSHGVPPHCTQYWAEWTLPLRVGGGGGVAARPTHTSSPHVLPPHLPNDASRAEVCPHHPQPAQKPQCPPGWRAGEGLLTLGSVELGLFNCGDRERGKRFSPRAPQRATRVPRGQKPLHLAVHPTPSCTVGKSSVIPPAGINQESRAPGEREGEQAGAATSGHLETSPCHPR